MSINLYGQLGRMPEKADELRSVLEEIVQKYDIKRIEVYLKNPE
jgi:CRISPR/Cas system CSM-associated protein Csm2 small subunit